MSKKNDEFDSQKVLSSSVRECPNCGAGLRFSPVSQKLHCDNCGSDIDFEKSVNVIKNYYDENKVTASDNSEWARENKVFKCETCGAEVILDSRDITKTCPYCGSNYVSETKELPGLKPDAVTPFAFNEEEAAVRFQKGVRKKLFAPRAIKKKAPPSLIRPFYFPAFSFDMNTYSKYVGELVRTRTVKEGKEFRTVTYTVPISGTYDMNFTDLMTESSSKLTKKDLVGILPYNTNESYVFSPEFIRGYNVEHYEDSLITCHGVAVKQAEAAIRKAILSQYSYSSVAYLDVHTSYENEMYLYRLMPVYNFGFKYKKKDYNVLMNGQTGKVGRGVPISPWRVAIAVVLGLALAALLAWLIIKS